MPKLDPPLAIALAMLAVAAGGWDLATRRIPNPLVIAGMLFGLTLNSWFGGLAGLGQALLGGALGFALFLPMFLLQGKGGGDVKLMAAIGSITGPQNCLVVFILIALIGGVMAIAVLLTRRGLLRALRNCVFILAELIRLRAPHRADPSLSIDHPDSVKLPYGLAMGLGCLAFLML